MGKATGIFLILAGIGTAALVLPKVDADAERQLAEVVRIATGNTPPAPLAEPAATSVRLKSTASSQAVQASISEKGRSSRGDQEAALLPPQAPTQRPREAVAVVAPPVLIAPPQPVMRNAAQLRTDDAQGRQALARDIQKELKRVGCYEGEISGEWNTATKKAMAQFIGHLNAALPSDEPDHILRAMVQGYPGNACGRATPSAIVAQASPAKSASAKAADQPPTRDIANARPTVPKPSWETAVTVARTTPATQPPLSTEGRMAMGGSVALTPAPTVTGSITTPELKPISPSPASGVTTATTAITTPGTIAALSNGGPPVEPQSDVRSVAPARSEELGAAERRARQRERERSQASSEQWSYPQAYRLGAKVPKNDAPERNTSSSSNSSGGTFTQRFFARQKTGFDTR